MAVPVVSSLSQLLRDFLRRLAFLDFGVELLYQRLASFDIVQVYLCYGVVVLVLLFCFLLGVPLFHFVQVFYVLVVEIRFA